MPPSNSTLAPVKMRVYQPREIRTLQGLFKEHYQKLADRLYWPQDREGAPE